MGYASNGCSGTVYYLEDRSNQLTVHQILKIHPDSFIISHNQSPNISFSPSALWVKVILAPHTDNQVLTFSNFHLDTLNAYFIRNGSPQRSYQTGDGRPFFSRDIPTNHFSFLVHPNEDTLVVKLKSSGTVSTPINIRSLRDYMAYEQYHHSILWLFYGVVLASLMANIIFFIVLKDKLYLLYVLFVLANALYTAVDFGLAFQFLWPNTPFINKFSLVFYSSTLFIYIFCDHFLELKTKYPRLHFVFNVFILANILCATVSLLNYNIGAKILTASFLCFPFLIFFTTLYVYLKSRKKTIILFLAAWTLYLAGVVIYTLAAAGIVSYSAYIPLAVLLCSTFEMVMLFVIVVFQVNNIKEENIKSKNQIIDLLSDREKILEEQNILLEKRVKERTMEMFEKNDEISSQNEEIVSQNEELLLQQQELMKQRQELEIQRMELDEVNKAYTEVNRRLNEYKIHLEELVNIRTNELTKANSELEEKNGQLEQYAFMAAHNLRSPIAALLGLTKFVESETDMEALKEVTKRINVSVKKLDVVVKSMSTILNSRNASEKPLETILLENALTEALTMLEKEVTESHTVISHDFSKCPEVKAISTYLHNLFFNLISNSIKYRKETEAPSIHISSDKSETGFIITFNDNGLGIDTEKYGKDLFKPFKRFHAKAEGSGIGLHLVKTQIESMGGTIEMESALGVGTTFIITLPS